MHIRSYNDSERNKNPETCNFRKAPSEFAIGWHFGGILLRIWVYVWRRINYRDTILNIGMTEATLLNNDRPGDLAFVVDRRNNR